MDFIILKVNGTDVSSFPHEDAVRVFLTAQEPIVVEVKRRISDSSTEIRTPSKSSQFVSTGVQTELSTVDWLEDNSIEGLSNDIDFEEVTLRKCSSDEKLGLTVCYNSGSEVDTEVYIRDIAPQSVADKDGRLQKGDQILQVNGKDVSSKEETECLFAENRKAVTLLVSRMDRSEDYLDTDNFIEPMSPIDRNTYQNTAIEQFIQSESRHFQRADRDAQYMQDKLNLTNSLVRSKLDSINHEILELDHRMQSIQLVKTDKRQLQQLPNIPDSCESVSEHIYETIPESVDSELEPIYSCPYEAAEENIVEQWLKTQNEGWNPLKDNKEGKTKEKSRSKSSKSNSSGEEHENSSSAYNTGGSCNSNPLTFELVNSSLDQEKKETFRSTFVLCPPPEEPKAPSQQLQQQPAQQLHPQLGQDSCKTCKTCKQNILSSKQKHSKPSSSKANSPSSPTNRPGLCPVNIISDTMYTNAANLQQTMLLQQQLLRQALSQNPDNSKTNYTVPNLSQYRFVSSQQVQSNHQETSTPDTVMEWKVKRRSDGTRYIARRPVRNRILKNRELRINEERSVLTTEDDTISEVKIGRYWTKEERKKHLEKSRERKQKELELSKTIDENFVKKEANNFDNTAKKHKSKKSHKDGCDHFTTVQEVLVHGPKSVPNQNSKMLGLLSVTTV